MKIACLKTYATLCIYSETESQLASVIEGLTGLLPSRTVENKQRSFGGFTLARYGWFLTSKDVVDSLDASDHIRWICQKIERPEVIASMRNNKYDVHLSCFWSSDGGGGGPVIPKGLIVDLASLGLDLEFDIYLGSDETRH